jgi:hypothetical protein
VWCPADSMHKEDRHAGPPIKAFEGRLDPASSVSKRHWILDHLAPRAVQNDGHCHATNY